MTLRDLLDYIKDNNVPEWAVVCFENLDFGGYVNATSVKFDEKDCSLTLRLDLF